jgi:hypothetical protein
VSAPATTPPAEADESVLEFEAAIAELGEDSARLEQLRRLLEAHRRG